MGIAVMKKARVLAHGTHRDAILAVLQDAGILELREIEAEDEPHRTPLELDEDVQSAAKRLEKLERCCALAERFRPARKTAETISEPLVKVESEQLLNLRKETDIDFIYGKCLSIEADLAQSKSIQEDSAARMEALEPWRNMTVSPDDLDSCALVTFVPVVVPTNILSEIEQDFTSSGVCYVTKTIDQVEKVLHALVGYLRKDADSAQRILTTHGVRPVRFPVTDKPPLQAISSLKKAADEAAQKEVDAVKRAEDYGREWYDRVAVLTDDAASIKNRLEIEQTFIYTERTFCFEGWIAEQRIPELERALNSIGPETHLTIENPSEGDDIPVVLRNVRLFRPMEMVLGLYGSPFYGTVDPVPYFSPFFILFYGLCLGDAGYGIVTALGGLYILKKFRPTGGLRDMSVILLLGGISSTVVGALTGSWFGASSEMLPKIMRGIFNPVEDPMTMLYISLLLGITQILFGFGIKMCVNISQGRAKDAVMDQLLWMLYIISLVPLSYKYIFAQEVGPTMLKTAGISAGVLAILLLLTQGRSQKSVFLKLPAGLYKLYDTIALFGDVLSYSRILALGLAGASIAMAFNDIAGMAKDQLPRGVGITAAVLIVIGGHVFNISINVLGSFVHSARLQYLEFFSKFYESGGRLFSPLKRVEKYSTVIKRSL